MLSIDYVESMTSSADTSAVALVYNPIKVNQRTLLREFHKAAKRAGRELRLFETTETDAGECCTLRAIAEGAGLVIAAGGDGTVRAVTQGLRRASLQGKRVPLAIVPSGTGNLLARNIGLPLNSLAQAASIAFGSQHTDIDLGVAQFTLAEESQHTTNAELAQLAMQTAHQRTELGQHPDEPHPTTAQISTIDLESEHTSEHVFLVLAGIGLDAHMIRNTHPTLKKSVGWVAYLVGGVRSLLSSRRVRMSFIVGDQKKRSHRVHTIMIANCGELPGGLRFLPEARINDGLLDIVVLRAEGFIGWWQVTWQMIWQNGFRRQHTAGKKIRENDNERRTVNYLTGDSIKLLPSVPSPIELDGDVLGTVERMHCWVEHGALTVMVAGDEVRKAT